ncbi:hypothetical protein HAX54_045445, partial [Datura stramonium]|nr:hypothetical protein [Datura stramonium]
MAWRGSTWRAKYGNSFIVSLDEENQDPDQMIATIAINIALLTKKLPSLRSE